MMKKVCIYVNSKNPYDSIFLQTQLLSNLLKKKLGVVPFFIDKGEFNFYLNKCEYIILFPYGSFSFDLLFKSRLSNVILIYHNITPAKYFWTTEPLVAVRAIMGRLQLRLLSKKISKVVAVSEYNRIELTSLGFTNPLMCPNIITRQESTSVPKTTNPSLLYVGRIVQNKDCVNLLQIVINVANKLNSPIDFYVVGNGKEKSRYYKKFAYLLKKTSLLSNLSVYWYNKIDDKELASLYQKNWLYVTLSKHEGFGLPVCEAINNGTPAIYSACGGQEQVLDNIGIVDKQNFESEIIELLKDNQKRQNLLLRQKEVIQKYMNPQIDETIKNIYRVIIED